MLKNYRLMLLLLAIGLVLSMVGLAACSGENNGTTTGTTSKPTTAITNTPVDESKANITGNLVAVRVSKGAYPWELDVKIADAGDVIGFTNPLKGKQGETVTFKTLKYMLGFTLGQGVSMLITQETGPDGTYLVASEIKG